MSELRDLTAALRAQSRRLDSFGESLILLLRDSAQQSEWRHQQRNDEHMRKAERKELLDTLEAMQKGLKQVEMFQSALWTYLGKLDERQELLAKTRHEDIREVKLRLRALEDDEVTQA